HDAPARVLDLIFDGGAVPLHGIAPIVLRDEFLLGAGCDERRRPTELPEGAIPSAGVPPLVIDRSPHRSIGHWRSDLAAHRQANVVLVVNPPCHPCDHALADDLLDEDHTPPPFPFVPAMDVEAQVDLV